LGRNFGRREQATGNLALCFGIDVMQASFCYVVFIRPVIGGRYPTIPVVSAQLVKRLQKLAPVRIALAARVDGASRHGKKRWIICIAAMRIPVGVQGDSLALHHICCGNEGPATSSVVV